ncbi:hypothetical protein WJX82_003771 [Trebouxia sp. C0006]
MIDILQEQDASASVLVEIEGKLDCERFCRYWTSDYGRWTHSKRQSNLEMQCCEDAPAAAKAFETQQAILQDMRYRTPAEMIRVVAAYWSQGLNADELGGIFTSSALQGLGSLVYAQEEKLILAVWRDDQGDWKEHAEDLSSVQKEEMQRAADDSQRQQERRVRHAQSALQMLMDNREETGPPEDPQQNWRLGAASADDAMGAVRISLRRWLLRS